MAWCTNCFNPDYIPDSILSCPKCGSSWLESRAAPDSPLLRKVEVEYEGSKYIVVFRADAPGAILIPGYAEQEQDWSKVLLSVREREEIFALAKKEFQRT